MIAGFFLEVIKNVERGYEDPYQETPFRGSKYSPNSKGPLMDKISIIRALFIRIYRIVDEFWVSSK